MRTALALLTASLILTPAPGPAAGAQAGPPREGRQSLTATGPPVVVLGQRISVRGTVRPARAGRELRLQQRVGSRWLVVAAAEQGRSAGTVLSFRPARVGTTRLRLVALRDRDLPYRRSAVMASRVARAIEYALPHPTGSWISRDGPDLFTSDISGNGRWVAARSAHPRFTRPGEDVEDPRIVVYDRATRVAQRISPGGGFDPSISDNGSRVAYTEVLRLVPESAGSRGRHTLVWDKRTGRSVVVSPSGGEHRHPKISGRGDHVVWWDGNSLDSMVRWQDLRTGRSRLLRGPGARWDTYRPYISADGATVVMGAQLRHVGPPVNGNAPRPTTVLRWREGEGWTDLFAGNHAERRQHLLATALSDDGNRLVYFRRTELSGYPATTYYRDIATGTDRVAFTDSIGEDNAISGNGRYVVHNYIANAEESSPCGVPRGFCVIRWDSRTGATDLLFRDPTGGAHVPSSDRTGTLITLGVGGARVPEERGLMGDYVVQHLPHPE